ncbi:Toluene-4-monooxygenase effector protein complex, benzene monooxygenase ferredoxin (modular protein) [Cupriavidus taiwanensis]|uniref:Toluene-4-monooxygenase effector protein complex, benzene monooxygenase ferredoxin (Modular protein) n=1 Tax=Cupriavidus taiwanensis TaxID=164546 RepID=A0A375JBP9_9BURK|nr:Toluene-4-monooxygenase effector protein complex, benzene monooxygenase ferredoxin (modular protein) [Cupriavidus taiwanensis]
MRSAKELRLTSSSDILNGWPSASSSVARRRISSPSVSMRTYARLSSTRISFPGLSSRAASMTPDVMLLARRMGPTRLFRYASAVLWSLLMVGSYAISEVSEQWLDAIDSDEDVVPLNLDGILGKTAPSGIEALARVGIEDPLVRPAHQYAAVELSLCERNVLVWTDALKRARRVAFGADEHDDVAVHLHLGHVALPQLVECADLLEFMLISGIAKDEFERLHRFDIGVAEPGVAGVELVAPLAPHSDDLAGLGRHTAAD